MTKDQNKDAFRNVNVSPDYGQTIHWKILQGRDFSAITSGRQCDDLK